VRHTAKWKPWRVKSYIAISDQVRAAELERYLKSASGRAMLKETSLSVCCAVPEYILNSPERNHLPSRYARSVAENENSQTTESGDIVFGLGVRQFLKRSELLEIELIARLWCRKRAGISDNGIRPR
jgi:hypothetical protein